MRKAFIVVVTLSLVACSNKQNIDTENALTNLKIYLKTKLKDVNTIDSLKISLDSLTEKRKFQLQAYEYLANQHGWETYNTKYGFSDHNYTDDYRQKQADRYSKMSEKFFELMKNADSTALLLWSVHYSGIFTKQDMTQERFNDWIYMTKGFKIVPKSKVIDYGIDPYLGYARDVDEILTLDYPGRQMAPEEIDSIINFAERKE